MASALKGFSDYKNILVKRALNLESEIWVLFLCGFGSSHFNTLKTYFLYL